MLEPRKQALAVIAANNNRRVELEPPLVNKPFDKLLIKASD
jgi:hypothetical protein